MGMTLKVNVQEDEELREYARHLILSAATSVTRAEILDVVVNTTKEKLAAISEDSIRKQMEAQARNYSIQDMTMRVISSLIETEVYTAMRTMDIQGILEKEIKAAAEKLVSRKLGSMLTGISDA